MGVLSQINKDLKSGQSTLFNSNPSQKSGKLGGITSDVKGITKTVTGTVSGVGHTVAKISGKLSGLPVVGGALGKVSEFLNGSQNGSYKEQPYENGLKSFYNRMGGWDKNSLAYHIDTMNTFECYIEFFPTVTQFQSQDTELKKILANCMKESQNFKRPRIDQAEDPSSGSIYNDNYLDFGIFIQRLTLPQMTTNGGETVNTLVGEFPLNGTYVKPDTNTFQMEIVNTRQPIGENIFYPWMREVTLPFWVYDDQPYTTADITIDLSEHTNIKYKFLNCRPTQIQSYQPTQEPTQSFSRLITFVFDYMIVENVNQSVDDYSKEQKIIDAIKEIGQEEKSTLDKIVDFGNKVNHVATNILKI